MFVDRSHPLHTITFSQLNPHRLHVVGELGSGNSWGVFRGKTLLKMCDTYLEAITYATKEAQHMSYEVVYDPHNEHHCDLPDSTDFAAGTLIKCKSCGTYYVCAVHQQYNEDNRYWRVVEDLTAPFSNLFGRDS